MNTTKFKVGFVGLGVMGNPMTSNIAKSGLFDLALFDLDYEKASTLAEEIGASAAATSSELADRDIVVLMLPTSAIVRKVLLADDGELNIPLQAGTIVVDMSSSDPSETIETGDALAQHGVVLVDAPVSGAKERAEAGTLAIMMGAPTDEAAERASTVVETMSSKIFRTGGLGTGHAMKALNNFVAATSLAASSEALIAGARFGLDPHTMVEVMNASTGQSFATTHVLPQHVVGGKFATGFALPLITKDIKIAHKLQETVNHHAPVCDAVNAAFSAAHENLGNVDHSLAYTFWDKN